MEPSAIEELVRAAVEERALLAWERVILQLLNWPFLLFAFLVVFAIIYRKRVIGLLERGDIEISWGANRHIKLRELSERIDQDLDPLKEEIFELKEELETLKQRTGDTGEVDFPPEEPPEEEIQCAKDRIYKALQSPKFRWRSVEKLAKFSHLTQDQVLRILSHDDNVVLGVDKSGQQLARLKNR